MDERVSLPIVLIVAAVLSSCEQPPQAKAPPTDRQPQTPRPDLCKDIDEACRRLADELTPRLSRETPLAVLPFTDSEGGVRRLGVAAGDEMQRRLARAGLQVVDRRHLNALLAERDLQMSNLVSGKPMEQAHEITGADVLILGAMAEVGGDVELSAKAVNVHTGKVLAATGNAALPAAGLGQLMWYVRRPPMSSPQGNLPPLAIRYEFVTPTATGEMRLDDGGTVTSGQKFKIRVQPNSDCWLYVLLYDSRGTPTVLFPHSQIQMSNEVRGGASYEIPEGAKWYWFDEAPGTETFYVVAGYAPLTDLDEILARMRQAGAQTSALASAAKEQIDGRITRGMSEGTSSAYRPKGFRIQTRGVGGVVDLGWCGQDAKTTERIDDVVVGHATAVKRLMLRHR